MRRLHFLIASISLACAACGSAPKKGPASASQPAAAEDAVTYDRSRCGGKGQRVVRLTTRSDGKPDIWKFYEGKQVQNATVEVLVCKQVDLNYDGKVDYVAYYDPEGRIAKEEIDRNFDGVMDQVNFYEAGVVVRKEYDRNADGKPDEWAYYEGGKLARIERDSSFKGRVDVWEHYEAGRLDRIGFDTTGTGAVDRWERAPERPDEDEGEGSRK